MAKVIQLSTQLPNIVDEIYEQHKLADRYREIEYKSAVKIQSWFRGIQLRTYVRYLKIAAIKIQKCWRGYLGRQKYRRILEDRVRIMKLNFYNYAATRIQKLWRGYYSRKYKFDYYKRKAYLNAIQRKNELILKELNEYKQYMDRTLEETRLVQKYKELEEEAKRNHYLLSTKVLPGIYNSPFLPLPHEKEYLMRNVQLDAPVKRPLYLKSFSTNNFESIKLPEGLPPLPKKPQGPFRDPVEVRKQRYRPLSPSLKVETDFESLDIARQQMKNKEWTERLHDQPFYPVHKSTINNKANDRILIHDKYKVLEYGTKCFRNETKEKYLPNGRFKTLVRAIPEFDKFNRTYMEQHFYLNSYHQKLENTS